MIHACTAHFPIAYSLKSVKDAARGIGVTYDKVRSRVDKDIDCNGYIVRKVKVNA